MHWTSISAPATDRVASVGAAQWAQFGGGACSAHSAIFTSGELDALALYLRSALSHTVCSLRFSRSAAASTHDTKPPDCARRMHETMNINSKTYASKQRQPPHHHHQPQRHSPGGGGHDREPRPPRRRNTVSPTGVYLNGRLMHATTSLIGNLVQVVVNDGVTYEGVLKTFSPNVSVGVLGARVPTLTALCSTKS